MDDRDRLKAIKMIPSRYIKTDLLSVRYRLLLFLIAQGGWVRQSARQTADELGLDGASAYDQSQVRKARKELVDRNLVEIGQVGGSAKFAYRALQD